MHSEAIIDYGSAIQLDSSRSIYHLYRGDALCGLMPPRLNQAHKEYSLCLEKEAANHEQESERTQQNALFRRGNVRKDLKLFEGAIADFTAVLRIDPSFAAAKYQRGVCYQQQALVDIAQVPSPY